MRQLKFYSSVSFFLWPLFFLVIFTSSCIPNKKLVYFADPAFNTQKITPIESDFPRQYRLQPRDLISVKIKTLDTESSAYFNLESGNSGFNVSPASIYLSGYSIDDKGEIQLPEVGIVQVGGLTINEAQQKIQKAVSYYLNNASTIVKLVNFKITVLGEVRSPGQYYVYNDQATLLEGIGMAGDLTVSGNRENITLLRQDNEGLGAVLLNLKDPEVLSSNFYYLQPNDVIYVQPLKAIATRRNLSSLGVVGLVLSMVSTAILISNNIR